MLCNRCGHNPCHCNCHSYTCNPFIECPIQLDTKCIIYNKNGNDESLLTSLNLPNGTTVKLILEQIDEKIAQLNVLNTNLPYLRTSYVINTLQQFLTAVDDKLSDLASAITGAVDISADSGNIISAHVDGIYAAASTLSVDYVNKTLSISGGNTVNLTGIFTTPSPYLGEVSSDPSGAVNGNYWWNTTSSTLKIRVNNTTRTITTT